MAKYLQNSWTTPKSLAHAIEISMCLPHGSCGDTVLRHFVTQNVAALLCYAAVLI